jgi:siroheme synthase
MTGAERIVWAVGGGQRLARTKEGDPEDRLRPSNSVDYIGESSVIFSVAAGMESASYVPT